MELYEKAYEVVEEVSQCHMDGFTQQSLLYFQLMFLATHWVCCSVSGTIICVALSVCWHEQ